MTVSSSTRRLSDILLEAVDTAEKQGRADISAALRIVQQALLVQELARQDLRRDTDEPDFVAFGLKHYANPSGGDRSTWQQDLKGRPVNPGPWGKGAANGCRSDKTCSGGGRLRDDIADSS